MDFLPPHCQSLYIVSEMKCIFMNFDVRTANFAIIIIIIIIIIISIMMIIIKQ